ncbi:MAG: 23S rRNA (guanosine(2251)-2'-O)-methyltransferase RlmB [Clostridia bacterium]|nr:23S rRNA (guanosine(2251)-2'-O)-methyltransferase RlmB [Clostridia bacterium]
MAFRDNKSGYGQKDFDRDVSRKGGRSYGDKPYGDRSYGKKNFDSDRPYGKKGFESDKPYGKKDFKSDKPYGKKGFDSDKPYGKKNFESDKPYGKKEFNSDKPFKKDFDSDRPFNKGRKDDRFNEAAPVQNDRPNPYAEDELPYIVMGRNAVREAIKSGRSIDRILVVKELDGSLREVIGLARDRNLQIREVDRSKLDEMCMPFGHGGKPGNHQGIIAQVPGVEYCDISDILDVAKERNEKPFIILLDGVEDPHNLGSIIRSAECAGAHGVIIPKRRSASVTASACKASAGAVEYMKVARVSNLGGAIDRLKDEGLWIAGADMAGTAMDKADLKGAIGLVIGSEGEGISRLIKEKCDFLVSIPMVGRIDSLNAAVAAAVLMFEKKRQG